MNPDLYVQIARHAGTREPELLRQALARVAEAPDEIADMLRRHHLLALVCAVAGEDLASAPRPEILDRLTARLPPRRVPLETLLQTFLDIRAALDERAVPWMLLKGFYFADRLYGGLDRRPQYDIDLLVPRGDFDVALRVFDQLGFSRKARDFHSHTLGRGAVYVDLHHSPRRSPAYSFDEVAVWRRARPARAGDLEFRTLSDEDYVTMLAASLFEDIGFGKGHLKQTLDLYLLLRDDDARIDWEAYFGAAPATIARVTANVLALIADAFDTEGELEHLSAALERRRDLIDHADRKEALRLVLAPRGRVENLLWFGRIYPGSVLYYRLRFWLRTFPGNLRNLDGNWLRRNAELALRTWTSPRRRHS
jgi:hypothetical protein